VNSGLAPLSPPPRSGRRHTELRKVRLGDVRPDGHLRFDALVRYAQDVSNDDTTDANLDDDLAWVVRRTVVDVVRGAVFGEILTFTTYCSGLGAAWAERRLQVTGDRGAHIEIATLWVHLDIVSGRPQKLPAHFLEIYAEAAGGRTVRARLEHGPAPGGPRRPWPVRFVDFDTVGHMNNAAYWAAVEEVIADRGFEPVGCRIELEYGHGVDRGRAVDLVIAEENPPGKPTGERSGFSLWWVCEDIGTAASGVVVPLPIEVDGAAFYEATDGSATGLNSDCR
jgi:acyl-ACP thioesterase